MCYFVVVSILNCKDYKFINFKYKSNSLEKIIEEILRFAQDDNK